MATNFTVLRNQIGVFACILLVQFSTVYLTVEAEEIKNSSNPRKDAPAVTPSPDADTETELRSPFHYPFGGFPGNSYGGPQVGQFPGYGADPYNSYNPHQNPHYNNNFNPAGGRPGRLPSSHQQQQPSSGRLPPNENVNNLGSYPNYQSQYPYGGSNNNGYPNNAYPNNQYPYEGGPQQRPPYGEYNPGYPSEYPNQNGKHESPNSAYNPQHSQNSYSPPPNNGNGYSNTPGNGHGQGIQQHPNSNANYPSQNLPNQNGQYNPSHQPNHNQYGNGNGQSQYRPAYQAGNNNNNYSPSQQVQKPGKTSPLLDVRNDRPLEGATPDGSSALNVDKNSASNDNGGIKQETPAWSFFEAEKPNE